MDKINNKPVFWVNSVVFTSIYLVYHYKYFMYISEVDDVKLVNLRALQNFTRDFENKNNS